MSDPETLDAMANLLDSIATACATMDAMKTAEAKKALLQATNAAASHIPSAKASSVSHLRPVEDPKERPL